jgi:hypothetical protein
MKNLGRAAAIMFGVVGLSGIAAALAVGCGGDDTVVSYGNDSSADSPTSDVATDTSTPTDSGADTSFHFDAGPSSLANFFHQIDQTGCARLESCCGGPTAFQVDGPGGCIDTFDNSPALFGFFYTRSLHDLVDGGGQVTFDQAKATECLNLIQNLSCTVPISSADTLAIQTACYGAITGTIAAGTAGCTDSIECVPPAHCDLSVNGGTCLAPLAAGTPCLSGAGNAASQDNCGRAYTGSPGSCEVGGLTTLSEAGTCAAPFTDGTPCFNPFECSSDLCDTPDGNPDLPYVCGAATTPLGNPFTCVSFPPDGG